MINVIITSYKEPKATVRAVKAILDQKIKDDFKIIVVDPFQESLDFVEKNVKDKRVEVFLDSGEGKSYALNMLFEMLYSENKKDLIIMSDGDVYISENAINEIASKFDDEKVGCVTGRPISIDSRDNKYGFWAQIAFLGIDRYRRKLAKEKKFFECSGYLFAIRNGVITQFPLETSEDSIIPHLFWKKGYLIDYAQNAEVYVKNPSNWKDYLAQKVRNIKAHENLNKIAPDMIRTKSLFNEIKEGAFFAIRQPKNIEEFFWTIQLYFARLYIYIKAFFELRKKNKKYQDGWRTTEINSTKPLD